VNQTAITSFDKQKQIQFYEKEMEDTQDEWRIVVGHHPMYSAGHHGNNIEIIKSFESKFLDDQVCTKLY
jgi:lipoate-protein ligase B